MFEDWLKKDAPYPVALSKMSVSSSQADQLITFTNLNAMYLLAVMEFKQDYGTGKGDPCYQAFHYYTRYYSEAKNSAIRLQSHCPGIVLAVRMTVNLTLLI